MFEEYYCSAACEIRFSFFFFFFFSARLVGVFARFAAVFARGLFASFLEFPPKTS